MYSGWECGKAPSNEWIDQTTEFLNFAFSLLGVAETDTIKCPYAMCRNYFRHKRQTIEILLCKYGFREGYKIWTEHGENVFSHDECRHVANGEGLNEVDHMDHMLSDLVGECRPALDDEPSSSTKAFYRMVASADEKVHEKTDHSSLSALARLLAVKSEGSSSRPKNLSCSANNKNNKCKYGSDLILVHMNPLLIIVKKVQLFFTAN
jgi:hypothetical protein